MIDDALNSIERLHKLKTDGIITEADFESAKNKLLTQGISAKHRAVYPQPATFNKFDGTLPDENDFMAWLLLPLRRYADFNGRSRRKEFWLFLLVYVALIVVSGAFAGLSSDVGLAVLLLGCVALFIPQLALQVRRFHDQDKTGWFALLGLIPYIGPLIVLFFMLIEGTPDENRYGSSPVNYGFDEIAP